MPTPVQDAELEEREDRNIKEKRKRCDMDDECEELQEIISKRKREAQWWEDRIFKQKESGTLERRIKRLKEEAICREREIKEEKRIRRIVQESIAAQTRDK